MDIQQIILMVRELGSFGVIAICALRWMPRMVKALENLNNTLASHDTRSMMMFSALNNAQLDIKEIRENMMCKSELREILNKKGCLEHGTD